MRWVEYHPVESSSRRGVYYTVAKAEDGTWGCSCPRWIYHREDCKHIRQVKSQLARRQIVISLDDLPETARAQVQKAISRFSMIDIGE